MTNASVRQRSQMCARNVIREPRKSVAVGRLRAGLRRREADAEAMRAALLAHDEFLFSHTGDGVVAAGASPKAAVDAAVDAQRAVKLPVRMGSATGPCLKC